MRSGCLMKLCWCRYETAHSKFGKSIMVEGAVALSASIMLVRFCCL